MQPRSWRLASNSFLFSVVVYLRWNSFCSVAELICSSLRTSNSLKAAVCVDCIMRSGGNSEIESRAIVIGCVKSVRAILRYDFYIAWAVSLSCCTLIRQQLAAKTRPQNCSFVVKPVVNSLPSKLLFLYLSCTQQRLTKRNAYCAAIPA
jgi:hypothetical protein